MEARYEDCIDGLCSIKDQKSYTVLGKHLPKVFTFNLFMLLPNVFDPFTLFKKKTT